MYDSIVFGGGGIKGIAYVGALEELYQTKKIDWGQRCPTLKNICGVSIGALFALLITCKYSFLEIKDLILNTKYTDILKIDPLLLFQSLQEKKLGIDTGEKLRSFLISIVTKKGFDINVTFQDFDVNLYITTTNIETSELNVFSKTTTPTQTVIDVICASMALPPLFEPILIKNQYHADGAILNNFPFNYLLETYNFQTETTLGFYLKNQKVTIHDIQKSTFPILSYLQFIVNIYRSKTKKEGNIIYIQCDKVSSYDSNIDEIQDILIQNGKLACKQFFT